MRREGQEDIGEEVIRAFRCGSYGRDARSPCTTSTCCCHSGHCRLWRGRGRGRTGGEQNALDLKSRAASTEEVMDHLHEGGGHLSLAGRSPCRWRPTWRELVAQEPALAAAESAVAFLGRPLRL